MKQSETGPYSGFAELLATPVIRDKAVYYFSQDIVGRKLVTAAMTSH